MKEGFGGGVPAGFAGGVRTAVPIMVGYLGVGFAAGVVQRAAGFSELEILLTSTFVFAGSVQFVMASMVAVASPVAAILTAVFLVNGRYLLMAAALAPSLKKLPWWKQALTGLQLTDQSFVVLTQRYRDRAAEDFAWIFGLQVASWLAWIVACFAGASASGASGLQALAFALPSMFAGLVVVMVHGHPRARIALCVVGGSAALALVIHHLTPGPWAATLAAIVGATAGLGLDRWVRRK